MSLMSPTDGLPPDILAGYDGVFPFWYRKNYADITPEDVAILAPYTYINKNLPGNKDLSVWIIHGDCDLTVPYLHSHRLNHRLMELLGEDRVTYRFIPGMGHASDPLYSDEELGLIEAYIKGKQIIRMTL